VGELASNVSHQIRNPLTSIKLNLQGLEEEAEAEGMSETSRRSLRICLREVAHLEEAVRKILGLARTHPPAGVETSLHEVISETVELLQRQFEANNVRIELSLEATEDRVVGDPEDLKNVFMNLLVNAEEAMAEGGAIRIVTEAPPGEESRPTIRVHIQDDGPGVPEEVRDQIFRPFVTTKPGGTGFGLAIARQAVQEHRGTLHLAPPSPQRVAPTPGRTGMVGPPEASGAVFIVELPLAPSAGSARERQRPEITSSSIQSGTGKREGP
jgi:two-component system sensor histidine kinase AtoS